jgi:MYXO-CTERM domain-containing protein
MRACAFTASLIVTTALAGVAAAETYYVDPGGDDGASGLMGSPWLTLQHAADSVAAGDTVMVQPGNYAGMNVTTGGVDGMPITFSAENGVVVDGDNPDTPDGINVEDADWVVIEGFTVVGRTRTGIRCALGDHVTIRNNVARDNGNWGILTGFCNDLLIEGNECSGSIDEHGIYVSNSADRPIVRRNVSHDNNANGLHMNGDVSLGGDGLIEDAVVEGNVFYGNGAAGGSAINCDGCQRALIQNNLAYDNHASGISLYAIDAAMGAQDNIVVNNTIVVAADGRWALNIQDGSTGNTAYNNVLLNLGDGGSIDISMDSLPGFVSDFNVTADLFTTDGGTPLTLAEWQAQTGQDASSLVAAPDSIFVDAGADFHLAAGSSPVDAGTAMNAPATDLEGVPRPQGAAVDIGAYEWCEGDCSGAGGGPPVGAGGGGSGPGSGPSGSGGSAADDIAGEESGCGCAVPGSSASRPAALFLVLGLALAARRRQR